MQASAGRRENGLLNQPANQHRAALLTGETLGGACCACWPRSACCASARRHQPLWSASCGSASSPGPSCGARCCGCGAERHGSGLRRAAMWVLWAAAELAARPHAQTWKHCSEQQHPRPPFATSSNRECAAMGPCPVHKQPPVGKHKTSQPHSSPGGCYPSTHMVQSLPSRFTGARPHFFWYSSPWACASCMCTWAARKTAGVGWQGCGRPCGDRCRCDALHTRILRKHGLWCTHGMQASRRQLHTAAHRATRPACCQAVCRWLQPGSFSKSFNRYLHLNQAHLPRLLVRVPVLLVAHLQARSEGARQRAAVMPSAIDW